MRPAALWRRSARTRAAACAPYMFAGLSFRPQAATSASPEPLVVACNVYVSEGRKQDVINQLKVRSWGCSHCAVAVPLIRATPDPQERADSHRAAVLVNLFVDGPYNRTGITLASTRLPEAGRDWAHIACPCTDSCHHSLADSEPASLPADPTV